MATPPWVRGRGGRWPAKPQRVLGADAVEHEGREETHDATRHRGSREGKAVVLGDLRLW